jgi:hypothetical protein
MEHDTKTREFFRLFFGLQAVASAFAAYQYIGNMGCSTLSS